jgi:hypothetical protein
MKKQVMVVIGAVFLSAIFIGCGSLTQNKEVSDNKLVLEYFGNQPDIKNLPSSAELKPAQNLSDLKPGDVTTKSIITVGGSPRYGYCPAGSPGGGSNYSNITVVSP